MVNYPCAFSQSELGKYFERIIKELNALGSVIVKGIMEINETSIKANLVKNHFGTEEIDLKETWLRNI